VIILAVFNGLFVYANLKIFYIFNSWLRIDFPNMILWTKQTSANKNRDTASMLER